MSENEFLNALKEEMPEDFGRELLAQLKAEKQQKVKPFPAFWTVAAASIVTVLVGVVLFMNRVPNSNPLSTALEAWQMREPITPENIDRLQPLLTIGNGHAQAIALSPDNNTLAVGTTNGIYLHDAHDLDLPPRTLPLPFEVEGFASPDDGIAYMEYSDDGRLFAFVTTPNVMTLYQWDEDNQSYLSLYRTNFTGETAKLVDISPDGTKLFLGTCNNRQAYGEDCPNRFLGRIVVVDLLSHENIYYHSTTQINTAAAAISSDWAMLAYQEQSEIKLYNLETQETKTLLGIGSFEQPTIVPDNAVKLSFSTDGSQLIVVDNAAFPIHSWEIADLLNRPEPLLVTAFGHEMYDASSSQPVFAVNPITGEYLVGSDTTLSIYEPSPITSWLNIASNSILRSVLVSSDGSTIYGLDNTGLIRVWNWQNLSLQTAISRYGMGMYFDFSFSPNSNLFAAGNFGYYDSLNYIWNIAGAEVEQTPLVAGDGRYSPVQNTAISNDERYVVYAQDKELWLFDRQTGRLRDLETVGDYPAFVFQADNSLLIVQESAGTTIIRVYTSDMLANGLSPDPSADIPLDTQALIMTDAAIPRFSLSPDGRILLLNACLDGQVRDMQQACGGHILHIWDTTTGQEIRELRPDVAENGFYWGIGFSVDSRWMALSYCSEMEWFDNGTAWNCHENARILEIWDINQLTTTSAIPTIRLENMATGFYPDEFLSYADGSFLFTSSDFSMNGSSPTPYTVFWHFKANGDYEELYRIPGMATSLAPDGSYILSSENGQIQLWGVAPSVASGE